MKLLLTTCLLFALLPAGASLQCYFCAGDQEACRHPTVIECDKEEDSCASLALALDLGDLRLGTVAAKSCVQSRYWHTGNFTLATTHGIFATAADEECQKDLCNRKTITLPRRSQLPKNGWQCPACISFSSNECQSKGMIPCRGTETKCIHYGATAKAPEDIELSLAFRGCVTPNSCNYTEGEREVADGLITGNVTHLRCTNARRSAAALEGYDKASQLLFNLPFMSLKMRDEELRN